MEERLKNDIDAPDEGDINATRKTMEDAVYEALDIGLDELKSNDTIDESFISQPIKNDQSVKNFISHLNDPNFEVQKQDYMALIEYVSVVEKQYGSILNELNALKERVSGIKDKENHLVSIVAKAQEVAIDIGEKLNNLKDCIITFTQNALETVKEKGLITLDKVSGFLEIKVNLQALSNNLGKAIDHAEKSIQKIDSISREYHEMENSAANIGRIFAGKETSSDIKENGKLAKALQLPHVGLQKILTAMSDTVKKAIEKVQSLEAYASERQLHTTNVTLTEKDMPFSSDLKVAQGNNVFVLSEMGYRHRAAKGLNDIKPGQSFPEYKNKVPKSWAEKGWVKEASPDTLPDIQQNQTARAELPNNRQPIIVLEP